ncbi:MAG: NAD(P)-binding domain-containing protein [Candidatus Yanofskybacteria bacterium]|nr:NAD(P)-binding domain-containing protein [Candidatus Yanofskybacteria bacterium]
MYRAISRVAIIGGGTMGSGIGQHIAQKGIAVVVKEANSERAQACKEQIFGRLDKAARAGIISLSDVVSTKARFSTTCSYDDIKDSDLVIEAVFENMEAKKAVFRELNFLFPEDVIFTTNSSSLSITEIASITNRPDRFIGTHFFNPAFTAPLVELIKGDKTSNETHFTAHRFTQTNLGKTPILVKGCPGYLVNRLLLPYLNEAVRLLTETRLTVKQIDSRADKFGWPMGPFKLLDFVGIDIAANVAKILYAGYGERAEPALLMHRLVELSRIGNKVGAGFYAKADGLEDIQLIIDREYPNRLELDVEEGFKRMMAGLCNEALLCLSEEIASADIIETGATLGILFPMAFEGPLHFAEEKYGLANLLADLKRFEREYGMRFKPAILLEELVSQNKKIFEKAEEEEW